MKSSSTHLAADVSSFETFTKETAPEGSRAALKRLEESIGAIPNLAATMAGSPALIQGFVNLREINAKESSLSEQEKELLFLTNAAANGCNYCQAVQDEEGIGPAARIKAQTAREQSGVNPAPQGGFLSGPCGLMRPFLARGMYSGLATVGPLLSFPDIDWLSLRLVNSATRLGAV